MAYPFKHSGKSKYHSRKTKVAGITFDSSREAKRWKELQLLEAAGEISDLTRQQKFILIPSQRVEGKLVERECSYYADFTYRDKEGTFVVEDAKGFRTDVYKIKRKLMLQRFGIQIKEV